MIATMSSRIKQQLNINPKKKVLYGDDDTVFRGTYTILGRWELFLGYPETFSITFIPWMKTWNSTLR